MSNFNLPDDVSTRDLPGFRDHDVKRDRAYGRADSDVKNGRFDSDDLLSALKLAISEDWEGLQEALATDNDASLGNAISIALMDQLAEEILRGER